MTDPRGRHHLSLQPDTSPVRRGRTAHDREPESWHHDGSFHQYMAYKNRKLQAQFAEEREAAGGSKLFSGVTIHVNGLTTPTHQELKQLMAQHGGTFELYYSRSRVTHIICSNLPTAKIKALEKERASTPVVRPEWIVDSLKAGRVLPTEPYLLWRLRDRPGQSTLGRFPAQAFGRSADAAGAALASQTHHQPAACLDGPQAAADASEAAAPQPPAEASSPAVSGDASPGRGTDAAEGWEQAAAGEPRTGTPAEPERPGGVLPGAQASSQDRPPEVATVVPDSCSPIPAQPRQAPSGASRGAGQLQRAQAVAAACRAACDMLKGAPKSSREDPQFMENYWKASRLHFIGTWKARIEALAAKAAAAGAGQPPAAPSSGRRGERTIIHLDMDCFFASVAALTDASLRGLPLVVSHSNSAQGTGEVSSANYEARAFGIRAVMGIGEAKRRCPELVVMPYQYDKYQAISEQVYEILLRFTPAVQPVSCDEAFLDVTGRGDPEAVAAALRAEIERATGCTASAGIAHNVLLAKLATTAAKPNGQCRLPPDQVDRHLLPLAVDALPGVGWSTRRRLQALGIASVADLRQLSSRAALQREFGERSGALLWDAAHGRDERPVEPMKPRRSIGAEVNWGIRFQTEADAHAFLKGIAGEVQARMREARVRGRCISLKLKRRKDDAPEPPKFLGHGSCDNLSRSVTLSHATDAAATLAAEAAALLRALRVPADQIRGIGIAVSKLDSDPAAAAGGGRTGPLAGTATLPFKPRSAASIEPTARAGQAQPPEPVDAAAAPAERAAAANEADSDSGAEPLAAEASETDIRGPASPGCVYSGLQLELGEPDDTLASQAPAAAATAEPAIEPPGPGPGISGSGTPIVALPPASQVDQAVLDALPLPLKREYERAYGIGAFRGGGGRAKRGRRGGRQPTLAPGRPIRRHFTADAPASGAGPAAGLDLLNVDLAVLRELPLEVQQEVAAAMSRAEQLARLRPQPPPQLQPPPSPPAPAAVGPCEPDREQASQLWPGLEAALQRIGEALDCRPSSSEGSEAQASAASGGSSTEEAEARLEALGAVVLEFGRDCAAEDLEGLQFLLRRLQATGAAWPCLQPTLREWADALQAAVAQHWQGKRLLLAAPV